MSKIYIAIIMAVIGIGAIGGVVFTNSRSVSDSDLSVQTDHNEMPREASTAQNNNTTQSETPRNAEPLSGEVRATIVDFAFKPETLTVKRGTKIIWTNQDAARHDVTPDDGDSDAFRGSALLDKGQSYSFTFDTPGTYTYNCSPHPYMKGTVVVVE